MDKGENLRRYSLPTMQQIQYFLELYKLDSKKKAVTKVAKICGVDHGAVSRYFKLCRERGFLTDSYEFTELGEARVSGYQKIIYGLEDFFRGMELTEEQVRESVKNQLENVDYDVLVFMVQNLNRGSVGSSVRLKRSENAQKSFPLELFEKGRTPVWFMAFHLQEGGQMGISMADRGFEKPAYLCLSEEEAYLELRICEMTATSRVDGRLMEGHLESLKYAKDGFLYLAEITEEGSVRIPLDACRIKRYPGGEMNVLLQITVTCNVGRTHMPESAALLLFWL